MYMYMYFSQLTYMYMYMYDIIEWSHSYHSEESQEAPSHYMKPCSCFGWL